MTLEEFDGFTAATLSSPVPIGPDELLGEILGAAPETAAAGLPRWGLRLSLTPAQAQALCEEPRGDALDALLCLWQAAWAAQQHAQGHPCWGLPPFDPLEGWIVGA